MQNSITFYGSLVMRGEKAYLEIPDKQWIPQLAIEALGNGPVRIVISHDDKGKSSKLLAYYWAHMLPIISEAFNALGNHWDVKETHVQLKRLFPSHFPKGKPASISGMGKHRFEAYVRDVEQFASEFLCVNFVSKSEQHADATE